MCNNKSNNIVDLQKWTHRIEDMVFNKEAAMAAVPVKRMLPKMMKEKTFKC